MLNCTVSACRPNIARVARTMYRVESACCSVFSGTVLRTVRIPTYDYIYITILLTATGVLQSIERNKNRFVPFSHVQLF
jgi:hypothetical protein